MLLVTVNVYALYLLFINNILESIVVDVSMQFIQEIQSHFFTFLKCCCCYFPLCLLHHGTYETSHHFSQSRLQDYLLNPSENVKFLLKQSSSSHDSQHALHVEEEFEEVEHILQPSSRLRDHPDFSNRICFFFFSCF